MGARQREPRDLVIERGPAPVGVAVAIGARRRETIGMSWLRGLVIICAMARHALHALSLEHAIGVTSFARRRLVRADERECRLAVVEARVPPRGDRMARCAVGETGSGVTWSRYRASIGRVATLTRCAPSDELQLT
jgi:hypothetical protein